MSDGAVRDSARNSKLSRKLREVSTDHGTTWALSRSDTPHSSAPASHSARVVAKMFSPAARMDSSSLLRCSLPSTNNSESSMASGSTTESWLGISVA